MLKSRRATLLVVLLANALLCACGLTGELYLPDAAAPAEASAIAQPDDAAETEDDTPSDSDSETVANDTDAEAEQQ